jgi:hypothetical protein
MQNKIIIHYHIFKNAGTSVDRLLIQNFADKCSFKEFGGPTPVRAVAVRQWIQANPDMVVFSSHTAVPPSPDIEGVEIFPISFVRHPIDRIASAYAFERKQGLDSFGSTVARNSSLAGYIDIHLSLGHNSQCRNFLLMHFATFAKKVSADLEHRAVHAVDTLPFIGVVEQYDASIERLGQWLRPHFPEFKPIVARLNVTRNPDSPLDEKLSQIRAEIGDECYTKVLEANKVDIMLYERVVKRYCSNSA